MQKYILAALAALVLASCAQRSDVVVIASDATYPPMEFIDEATGQITGFDIDLMNAIAEAAGFEVEIRNVAWDGIFAGLAAGSYDGIISSVTINEERQATMDFSAPYYNAGQTLVVRAEDAATVNHISDLEGQLVGAQIGTTGAFTVEEYPVVSLRAYDEVGLAFEDLAQGRIAGVVADVPIAAEYALQSDNYRGVLVMVGEPLTNEYFGIAVNKGNAELLEKINLGLAAVIESGRMDEILQAWNLR